MSWVQTRFEEVAQTDLQEFPPLDNVCDIACREVVQLSEGVSSLVLVGSRIRRARLGSIGLHTKT